MQFIYHKDCGDTNLTIDGDLHKYIFKVRRTNIKEKLFFRNLKDDMLYEYEVFDIDKKQTKLNLINHEKKVVKANKDLHIGWCIIDHKNIEKILPSLNELGVYKISFIYCAYSQKQFKINFEKLEKIVINSSQQCGRSSLMKLEAYDNLDTFLDNYPDTFMFNFSSQLIDSKKDDIETILIGCEGGFSQNEVKKIGNEKVVGIDLNLILKSETAVVSVASKILV